MQYTPGGPIRSFDEMGEWEASSLIYGPRNGEFTHRRRYGPRQDWQPIVKKAKR